MANESTTKKTAKTSTRTAKTKAVKAETKPAAAVSQEADKIVAKEIDPNQYVRVLNGFQGKLIYQSSRTGEWFEWDGFGTEQEMELRELRNAKNSNKGFFINNWFMFEDPWIIDYLGVGQYYRNSVPIAEFDTLLKKPADKVGEAVSKMPEGQKASISYRARQLIAEGKIDSIKTITVLEKVLDTELIER